MNKEISNKGIMILCSTLFGMLCLTIALDNVILGVVGSIANILIIMLISSVGFILYPSDEIKDEEIRKGALRATNVVITIVALGVTAALLFPFDIPDEKFNAVAVGMFSNAWAARSFIAP